MMTLLFSIYKKTPNKSSLGDDVVIVVVVYLLGSAPNKLVNEF